MAGSLGICLGCEYTSEVGVVGGDGEEKLLPRLEIASTLDDEAGIGLELGV